MMFIATLAHRLIVTALVLALASPGLQAQPAAPATDAACPPIAQMPSAEALKAAAARARDRGMLWRISKDGRSSHLYGTVHLGKLDWAFPGEQVSRALMASDTLAVEIDLTDPAMRQRIAPPADAAVPELDAGLRERLARQIDAACLPREAMAAMHPVMQAITLVALSARRDGLDPGFAQELALAGLVRSTGRAVVSLETPELQMAVLMPRDSAVARRMIDQTLAQLETGVSRRTLARMGLAWEQGNLQDIADYPQWCDCMHDAEDQAMATRLNDDRNPAIADRIAALHGEGKNVFAAVGSLHMTGAQALPALLQARGFQVERVAFR
jgi:uncharacterized protein